MKIMLTLVAGALALGLSTTSLAASSSWSDPVTLSVTESSLAKLVLNMLNSYDVHDYPRLVSYFTDDAHYSSPTRGDLVGHSQIMEAMIKRPAQRLTRHAISNLVVTVTGADSADAHCIVTAYLNADGFSAKQPVPQTAAPAVADYAFKFRRVNGFWLISEKITQSVFEHSLAE
jgi:hypothetical protein